jgi:Mannosyltransferase (PIG-V)
MRGITLEAPPAPGRAAPEGWLRGAYRSHRYPLGVALASRVATYALLGLIGWRTRGTLGSRSLFDAAISPLGRWDASWYRWIALHGYDLAGAHGHHANVVAFSPLYPFAYRTVSAIPGPMTVWGSLLSTCLFTVALCLFHDLGRQTIGEAASRRACLYLALAPYAFVFSIPYTESLFLVLTLAAFMLGRTDRRWLAGAIAALAVITRPVGIALVPALAWQTYRNHARPRAYLPLVLPIVAQAALFAYLAIHTGDVLAPLHAQQHGWHRRPAILPVAIMQATVHAIQTANIADTINVVFTLLWGTLLRQAWRQRLPGEYLIYATLALLIPTSTGTLLSIGRFGLVAFPLFWTLGQVGSRPRIDAAIKITFPALLTLITLLVYTTTDLSP